MNAVRKIRFHHAAALMLALASASALAAGNTPAQKPEQKPAESQPAATTTQPAAQASTLPAYEHLDANRDGIVTLPEIDVYSNSFGARVHHCDADHNKRMSRDEYMTCTPRDVVEHHTPAGHHKHHGTGSGSPS